jgi:hypothetical protein
MKIKLIPSIIILLIFALFTALTYEDNAASDGFTKIGFPFNFYLYSAGKLADPALISDFGFSLKYFIADMAILVFFIFFGNLINEKWIKTNKSNDVS